MGERAKKEKVWQEELKVTGGAVTDAVKELLHQGNVRRITIKNSRGKTVIAIPVTVGVIGVLIAPTLAAVGAIVALGADYTIVVDRSENGTSSASSEGSTDGASEHPTDG